MGKGNANIWSKSQGAHLMDSYIGSVYSAKISLNWKIAKGFPQIHQKKYTAPDASTKDCWRKVADTFEFKTIKEKICKEESGIVEWEEEK